MPGFAPGGGPELPTHAMSLDIETVPDPAVPAPADEAFPRPIRHRVVCISVAVARIDRDPATGLESYAVEEIRSGGDASWTEERLLRAFWAMLAARPTKILGWNTRKFDLPTMHARSMLYGLDAGIYWRRGDRWSGYGSRYSETWACDVMDQLSSCGAAPAHTLDQVAAALGFAGKMGESGAAVAELYAAGEIERIRRYCETDVSNLIGIWFHYQRLTGRITETGLADALASLRRCLTADPEGRPHLAEFARRWQERRSRIPRGILREDVKQLPRGVRRSKTEAQP